MTDFSLSVHKIRDNLGMSQKVFAERIGIPVRTLRHWEIGDQKPSAVAIALVKLIKFSPAATLDILRRKENE